MHNDDFKPNSWGRESLNPSQISLYLSRVLRRQVFQVSVEKRPVGPQGLPKGGGYWKMGCQAKLPPSHIAGRGQGEGSKDAASRSSPTFRH